MWKNSINLFISKKKKKIDNLHLPKNYVGIHIRSTDKVLGLFQGYLKFHQNLQLPIFNWIYFLKIYL